MSPPMDLELAKELDDPDQTELDVEALEDILEDQEGGDETATITTTTTRQVDRGNRGALPMTGEVLGAAKLNRLHEVKISRVRAPRGMGGYWGSLPWDTTRDQLAETLGAGTYDCVWLDRRGRQQHQETIEIAADAQGVRNNAQPGGGGPGGAAMVHALANQRDGHNRVYEQMKEVGRGIEAQAKSNADMMRTEAAERMERERLLNDRDVQREQARADAAERRHELEMQRERERHEREASREQTRADSERGRDREFFQQFTLMQQAQANNGGGTDLVTALCKGLEMGQGMDTDEAWVKAISEGVSGIKSLAELKNGPPAPAAKQIGAGDEDQAADKDPKKKKRNPASSPEMAEFLSYRAECKARGIDGRELLRSTTDMIRDASPEEIEKMNAEVEDDDDDEQSTQETKAATNGTSNGAASAHLD